jgi:hypothetical protein
VRPSAGSPSATGPVLSSGVGAIRLCRYGPLPKLRLVGQYLTRSNSTIGGLVRQLNALGPAASGPVMCPLDTGTEVALLVRYRSGASATVTVDLDGCRTVTRGPVVRDAGNSRGGPALVAELVRLTR